MIGLAEPLWLALSTLVSEDLACVTAGAMVALGTIGMAPAILACFGGILAGDVLLWAAGRWLGRAAIGRAPLRWLVRPEDVRRGAAWFSRRGPVVILISRFVPGLRLPVYLAAGILGSRLPVFSLWAAIAAGIWTPLLVGVSMAGARAGGGLLAAGLAGAHPTGTAFLLAGATILLASTLIRLATRRGRALLRSTLRRLVRWEFWPPWAVYPPIVLYVLWLGARHRGLAVFAAANPAIPGGGFAGESKSAILRGLARGGAPVARFRAIPASMPPAARVAAARAFMAREGLAFPIVLKPDVGQRGSGVAIVRDGGDLERRLRASRVDRILQEHVGGLEYGVFYYRRPGAARGRVLSITEKRLPAVIGDGRRTLESLILDDARLTGMRRLHLTRHAERLAEVPAEGAEFPLVELGTHCRGAIFLDGEPLRTPALEAAIDRMARGYDGFHFGRFDLRAPSEEDLRQGRGLAVLELNGVTSESTDIYDPAHSLLHAWRRLALQWRLAFEIGRLNLDRGAPPTSLRELLRLALHGRRAVTAGAGRPSPGAAGA